MLKLIQTKAKVRIFITSMLLFFIADSIGKNTYELHTATNTQKDVVIQQVLFDANNISTWFYNTGMFNQDLRTSGTPGFQWPKGTGKFAIYSSGLCIGAYVNNELREAMCSYKGELAPGYVSDSAGHPVAKTDARFKVYSVRSTDGYNNPDWLNWGFMTAFGAPFVDVNHNGIYEWFIDTPGVKGAAQTLFASLTDGFPEEHKIGEGFGGGTTPLYADVRMTAWSYTAGCLADVIFVKWLVINRSQTAWNKTYFSVFNDNDLGDSPDDYNGCDTVLQMGYTYNGSDMDGTGQGVSYGLHPPAVGTMLLSGAVDRAYSPPRMLRLTSCVSLKNGIDCESDPNGEPYPAYTYMRGFKKDGTPYVIPPGGHNKRTKFCYSGDPESGQGWNEGLPGNPSGSVMNCGGPEIDTGAVVPVTPFGDMRSILNSGADNLTVNYTDSQTIVIAQLVARGTNFLNSVTKLKQLAQCVRDYYNQYIGIEPISSSVPKEFILYQNYPNPFNPSTNINYQLPASKNVKLIIYDFLGREIEILVNEEQQSGKYQVIWDASKFASGVYLYKIEAGSFTETKKMVLIK